MTNNTNKEQTSEHPSLTIQLPPKTPVSMALTQANIWVLNSTYDVVVIRKHIDLGKVIEITVTRNEHRQVTERWEFCNLLETIQPLLDGTAS